MIVSATSVCLSSECPTRRAVVVLLVLAVRASILSYCALYASLSLTLLGMCVCVCARGIGSREGWRLGDELLCCLACGSAAASLCGKTL